MDIIEKSTQLNQKLKSLKVYWDKQWWKINYPKLKDITTLILNNKFIAVTYMKKRAKVSRISLSLCFKELRKQKQNLNISIKKARQIRSSEEDQKSNKIQRT